MKMLTLVCREKFEYFMVVMFKELGIKGYTLMSGAGGSGQRGEAEHTAGQITTRSFWSPSMMLRWPHL
jgi:hypothetical protein